MEAYHSRKKPLNILQSRVLMFPPACDNIFNSQPRNPKRENLHKSLKAGIARALGSRKKFSADRTLPLSPNLCINEVNSHFPALSYSHANGSQASRSSRFCLNTSNKSRPQFRHHIRKNLWHRSFIGENLNSENTFCALNSSTIRRLDLKDRGDSLGHNDDQLQSFMREINRSLTICGSTKSRSAATKGGKDTHKKPLNRHEAKSSCGSYAPSAHPANIYKRVAKTSLTSPQIEICSTVGCVSLFD